MRTSADDVSELYQVCGEGNQFFVLMELQLMRTSVDDTLAQFHLCSDGTVKELHGQVLNTGGDFLGKRWSQEWKDHHFHQQLQGSLVQ